VDLWSSSDRHGRKGFIILFLILIMICI
jgi:hypothetical protein